MVTNPEPARMRDVVVVGCSAGGVEALPRLLQPLSARFGATVCIVQHMSPTHTPYLVDILRRTSRLPVSWAEQGEGMQRAHVYVAPPDVHLIFSGEHLMLAKGARENFSRPSIDKLFRSAAAQHGSRVVGVLLTGMLEDGVAGLVAIREAGGLVMIQDPDDAQFPDLPRHALGALEPDRMLPLASLGMELETVLNAPAAASAIPPYVAHEAELDRQQPMDPKQLDVLVENALWSAVRALHDRASTLETLATDAAKLGNAQTSEAYAERSREARRQIELARQFILDLVKS